MSRKAIQVVSATGEGDTLIGAFDSALNNAGVANYNLIRLSSVIPEGATVIELEKADVDGTWGNKLYVVMAIQYATEVGEEAHAGIGWAYDQDDDSHGLFVEHEGTSKEYVSRSIKSSLENLFASREMNMGHINKVTSKVTCEGKPVCAFVVAVFEEASWNEV